MTDLVREIEEKKRSSVIVMESGEKFWITRSQLAERETIEVGQEIDTDELRQWLLPRQYPMALNNAVELLAQRAHASGEIAQKLRRRLYMEDTIEMVLCKLEKERLLDDEAFARDWAASRTEEKIVKHLSICWKENNPNHQSKEAPKSESVEIREIEDGVLDFFNSFQKR